MQLSDKDEAVGAQGVPLTPGRSIAVDKSLHVYGTPFFIEGELPIESERSKTPFRRLMIAQDTGSAIIGPARADLYFGAGLDAGKVAGRLRHNARFVMLVPKSLDPVARGRKMPVPDARPSEKIAKLFPQTAPCRQKNGEAAEVTAATNTKPTAQAAAADASTPGLRKPPRSRRHRQTGAAARGAAEDRSGLDKAASSVTCAATAIADETPPSISIPELPEPPRRKRGLSEEERALWESVAKQVKPLRKKAAPSKAHRPPRRKPIRNVAPKPAASPRHVAPAKIAAPVKAAQPPPLAPLGRRERSHLSRGRKEIDARLDLHGMTQTRAHRALFGFLQRAHSDGLTFVLVITGKGKMGAESERGVLRRQVPQWLSLPEFRSLVVGFEEAHIGHGGEGALYVRVRRASSAI